MKAIVYDSYGPPDVLQVREVEDPDVGDTEVLIRIRAASINPLDWYAVTGTPLITRSGFGLKKPTGSKLGADLAGVVEAVGSGVTRFRPGDEVYGTGKGSLAELVVVGEDGSIAPKPANLSFEEAAAVPVAALTALQGLRDKGGVRAGQQVLINGAAGGVGTFAVQIAKAFDAVVTGVCSTRNAELVGSLGADRVVDYTNQDFTRSSQRFDLVIDIAGSRPWSELRRVLRPDATLVIIGGPKDNRMFGPLGHLVGTKIRSLAASQKTTFFISKENVADLITLTELIEDGRVRPVVEKTYPLDQTPEALTYLGTGHVQGKLVIRV
jgi:NADPH:quinone reductase-like Zn-dependent oxidoreductase